MMRKHPIVEIEDVKEPFCGSRIKKLVPLSDAEPEIAEEWFYEKNAGWGPEHFSRGSGVRCWWRCRFCLRGYKAQINNRTGKNRSACCFCASKEVCSDNALSVLFPDVAAEWHPTKNKGLKATDVTHASRKKVWWLCKICSHPWEAAPGDRTGLESGCPACYKARMQYAREHPKPRVRKQIVLGDKKKISRAWYEKPSSENFISILESNYSVAKQWHPTKNGEWTALDFSSGSDAIAWWKCKKGPDHEWQAPIYSRTGKRKSGCPYCTGKRVSVTNSLKSKFPKVAKEWHPKLNGKLRPEDVTYGSRKEVWWQCKRDSSHKWQVEVRSRTVLGTGCPDCAHKRVNADTCLAKEFPYIAAQLHPTKNGTLNGKEIFAYSGRKVWWFCPKGPDHEWEATPANRTYNGSTCPACDGRQLSVTNCLATVSPETAEYWDKKKNGKLTPSKVKATSKDVVSWRCELGHSWEQSICRRVKSPVACWECLGKTPPGGQSERTKKKVAKNSGRVTKTKKGSQRKGSKNSRY